MNTSQSTNLAAFRSLMRLMQGRAAASGDDDDERKEEEEEEEGDDSVNMSRIIR